MHAFLATLPQMFSLAILICTIESITITNDICVQISIDMHVYRYIYIEREREKNVYIYIYKYFYIYIYIYMGRYISKKASPIPPTPKIECL